MPDIDYLIISHDHWDHLDYNTVKKLRDRIGTVICPLGVGEHFEYWGFDKKQIVELDWDEDSSLEAGFKVYCLPARHFSGQRSFLPISRYGLLFYCKLLHRIFISVEMEDMILIMRK